MMSPGDKLCNGSVDDGLIGDRGDFMETEVSFSLSPEMN